MLRDFDAVLVADPFDDIGGDEFAMGVDSNVEVFLDGRYHVIEPPREGAITHACCSGYFGFKHGFHVRFTLVVAR